MKTLNTLGNVFLGVWLILTGLIGAFNFSFRGMNLVMTFISLAVAVFLVLPHSDNKPIINMGMLLLVMVLLTRGLLALLNTTFPGADVVLSVIATAAGVLLLFALVEARNFHTMGLFLLGVWLIMANLLPWFNLVYPYDHVVNSAVAFFAGVLLLIGL